MSTPIRTTTARVLTLAGPAEQVQDAVRSLARQTVTSIDLRQHHGVHPRLGALDVVPWISLAGWPVNDGPIAPAIQARDDFARWAGIELRLPCFLYGPERSLPEVRRQAWRTLSPDTGPDSPHPTAGASAVGDAAAPGRLQPVARPTRSVSRPSHRRCDPGTPAPSAGAGRGRPRTGVLQPRRPLLGWSRSRVRRGSHSSVRRPGRTGRARSQRHCRLDPPPPMEGTGPRPV